jgi:hypothetical protein
MAHMTYGSENNTDSVSNFNFLLQKRHSLFETVSTFCSDERHAQARQHTAPALSSPTMQRFTDRLSTVL